MFVFASSWTRRQIAPPTTTAAITAVNPTCLNRRKLKCSPTENISNTDYFGGMLRHSSSQGGIKDVVLDDKFFNTALDLTYRSRKKAMSWNADLGYQNQVYNWYGIYPGLLSDATIATIDEQQTYHTLYMGGRLGLDNILKESTFKFTRFWDAC